MKTQFTTWLEQTGLSRAEAAKKLGKCRSTIDGWAVGRLRGARRSHNVSPDYATRVLMRLIAEPELLRRPKHGVEPWAK